jgi:hypothetical protein
VLCMASARSPPAAAEAPDAAAGAPATPAIALAFSKLAARAAAASRSVTLGTVGWDWGASCRCEVAVCGSCCDLLTCCCCCCRCLPARELQPVLESADEAWEAIED